MDFHAHKNECNFFWRPSLLTKCMCLVSTKEELEAKDVLIFLLLITLITIYLVCCDILILFILIKKNLTTQLFKETKNKATKLWYFRAKQKNPTLSLFILVRQENHFPNGSWEMLNKKKDRCRKTEYFMGKRWFISWNGSLRRLKNIEQFHMKRKKVQGFNKKRNLLFYF